jgi:RHS repeat-associated protein
VGLSYDVFGNLVEEDITQGSTTVGKFAYNLVSGNGNAWGDLNSSNQVQTRREYLDAMDAVFARIASDGTEAWYLPDHLGSIRGLMDNSGSLVDTLTTDAWGNVTSESSPSTGDRFKFGGGQWDATMNLEHFGERWYDPMVARWVSQDPLGLGPDSNPYRYVHNGPTNSPDPSGLQEENQTITLDQGHIDEAVKQLYAYRDAHPNKGLSEKEIEIRRLILKNVMKGQATYAEGDEVRNNLWKGRKPKRGKELRAITSLWRKPSEEKGIDQPEIRCLAYARLILLKALIDYDKKDILTRRVLRKELYEYYNTKKPAPFWKKTDAKKGKVIPTRSLLPGDLIWFENPYWKYYTQDQREKNPGDSGSNG